MEEKQSMSAPPPPPPGPPPVSSSQSPVENSAPPPPQATTTLSNPPPPAQPNPSPNNIVRTPPNPIPNTSASTSIPLHQSQTRPPPPTFNTRPWQHQQQQQLPLTSSMTPRVTGSAGGGGGMAVGVPAPPPASFASLAPPSYPQQSQIRQPMQGMPMTGSLGTASMRPGGCISPAPLRPPHSSLRPGTNIQSPASQNFQGHGMLRVSTLGSPASLSPGNSQNQPWLSSGTQGKPPLPTPSLRPQTSPQSFQQRSHVPQQYPHSIPTTTQPPINSSQPPTQSLASTLPHEHYSQQFPPPRIQQPASHQQQITKGPGLASQRPPLTLLQSGALQIVAPTKTPVAPENEESSNRIVTKRSIQDLLSQIDPSEKFEPGVEDILVDIAEDFVETITSFGCSLAKHRKSSTLEPKDILLHLERNWNLTLPGFGGDEIKPYKKPFASDIHRERISAIRRSTVSSDPAMTTKNTGGPSGGNTKSHLAKGSVPTTEAS